MMLATRTFDTELAHDDDLWYAENNDVNSQVADTKKLPSSEGKGEHQPEIFNYDARNELKSQSFFTLDPEAKMDLGFLLWRSHYLPIGYRKKDRSPYDNSFLKKGSWYFFYGEESYHPCYIKDNDDKPWLRINPNFAPWWAPSFDAHYVDTRIFKDEIINIDIDYTNHRALHSFIHFLRQKYPNLLPHFIGDNKRNNHKQLSWMVYTDNRKSKKDGYIRQAWWLANKVLGGDTRHDSSTRFIRNPLFLGEEGNKMSSPYTWVTPYQYGLIIKDIFRNNRKLCNATRDLLPDKNCPTPLYGKNKWTPLIRPVEQDGLWDAKNGFYTLSGCETRYRHTPDDLYEMYLISDEYYGQPTWYLNEEKDHNGNVIGKNIGTSYISYQKIVRYNPLTLNGDAPSIDNYISLRILPTELIRALLDFAQTYGIITDNGDLHKLSEQEYEEMYKTMCLLHKTPAQAAQEVAIKILVNKIEEKEKRLKDNNLIKDNKDYNLLIGDEEIDNIECSVKLMHNNPMLLSCQAVECEGAWNNSVQQCFYAGSKKLSRYYTAMNHGVTALLSAWKNDNILLDLHDVAQYANNVYTVMSQKLGEPVMRKFRPSNFTWVYNKYILPSKKFSSADKEKIPSYLLQYLETNRVYKNLKKYASRGGKRKARHYKTSKKFRLMVQQQNSLAGKKSGALSREKKKAMHSVVTAGILQDARKNNHHFSSMSDIEKAYTHVDDNGKKYLSLPAKYKKKEKTVRRATNWLRREKNSTFAMLLAVLRASDTNKIIYKGYEPSREFLEYYGRNVAIEGITITTEDGNIIFQMSDPPPEEKIIDK